MGPGDPDMEALSTIERHLVARSWMLRSHAEGRAAGAMEIVASDLDALDAPPALIEVAERAVGEERRHARICAEVALAYDDSVPASKIDPAPIGDEHGHARVPWRARHVVGLCCISETFASAHLNTCRTRATSSRVRDAFHRLLEDEVGHAQLGWAFLACSVAPPPSLTATWVAPLLEVYRQHFVGRAAHHPNIDLPGHGCSRPGELLAQYLDAVDQLILPGFEHVGVSTEKARDWLAAARGRGPVAPSAVSE